MFICHGCRCSGGIIIPWHLTFCCSLISPTLNTLLPIFLGTKIFNEMGVDVWGKIMKKKSPKGGEWTGLRVR